MHFLNNLHKKNSKNCLYEKVFFGQKNMQFFSIVTLLACFYLVCAQKGESTLGGGTKIVVTLYFFLKVPCLNFNHVIIRKDFHNVLHIMVGQNPNKSNSI
jgi:hypothetical protein